MIAAPICSETLIEWAEFNAYGYISDRFDPRKRTAGRKSKTRKRAYIDAVCAFDIETSRLPCRDSAGDPAPQSIMYIWQFQAGLDYTITGRTWDDFLTFCNNIQSVLQDLSDDSGQDVRLVVYVHNLSHEFQFLAGVWQFSAADVFAVKARRVLRCDMGRIEFRCSYLHSNMSLDEYTHKMQVAHAKLPGDLDYNVVRYPWTPLTDQELQYCINDVRGLVECIYTEMEHDGDDLYTIPATSTGYVRRDARDAMYKYGIKHVRDLLPDFDTYLALREAFRGGDTHANRYYAGMILHDVKSVDMSSAYPAVQCECLFPVSPFRRHEPSVAELRKLLRRRRAVLCRVALFGVRQKYSWWGFPYIALGKCRHVSNPVNDNGRILAADYLETTITDVDLRIIAKEYVWDGMRVIDLWSAGYGNLPRNLQDVSKKYFGLKTELKNVPGQEVQYMKSKNKLNSVYGMTAQDPVHIDVKFIGGEWIDGASDLESMRAAYEENKKHLFLPYQWAVWTTAHTRRRLKVAQWAAGDGGVYCDTDSVKYVGECDLSAYNAQVKANARAGGCSAKDPAGKLHYMGVYEDEKPYADFVTWGAKKYCTAYEPGGKLTTTVAGVNKKLGGREIEQAGGLPAFRPGFVFRDAAGKLVIYNDDPCVTEWTAEGRTIKITRNIAICENTYTLGITTEYARLIGRELDKYE